jgi:hypothetical protein
VSVSFAIFCSSCLRQHSLSPARPRDGATAGGVQDGRRFKASATDTARLDVPRKSSLFRHGPAWEVPGSTRRKPVTCRAGERTWRVRVSPEDSRLAGSQPALSARGPSSLRIDLELFRSRS